MRGNALQLLVAEIGALRFGLRLSDVREVVRAVAIDPLPGAPDIVEGLINVRGEVVPVLDVRQRFGLAPKPVDLDDHMIVTDSSGFVSAFRVDRAEGIVECAEADIDTLGEASGAVEYVAGVAKLADGMVLVHDVRTFLSAPEVGLLSAALTTVGAA